MLEVLNIVIAHLCYVCSLHFDSELKVVVLVMMIVIKIVLTRSNLQTFSEMPHHP